MKANEFVKEFGLNAFRLSVGFVSTRRYLVVYEDEIDFTDEIRPSHGECVFDSSEVKRLVESHELIEKLGGLNEAKIYVPDGYKSERLKQAIADVESCQ